MVDLILFLIVAALFAGGFWCGSAFQRRFGKLSSKPATDKAGGHEQR